LPHRPPHVNGADAIPLGQGGDRRDINQYQTIFI
jgi:hypothetical protein